MATRLDQLHLLNLGGDPTLRVRILQARPDSPGAGLQVLDWEARLYDTASTETVAAWLHARRGTLGIPQLLGVQSIGDALAVATVPIEAVPLTLLARQVSRSAAYRIADALGSLVARLPAVRLDAAGLTCETVWLDAYGTVHLYLPEVTIHRAEHGIDTVPSHVPCADWSGVGAAPLAIGLVLVELLRGRVARDALVSDLIATGTSAQRYQDVLAQHLPIAGDPVEEKFVLQRLLHHYGDARPSLDETRRACRMNASDWQALEREAADLVPRLLSEPTDYVVPKPSVGPVDPQQAPRPVTWTGTLGGPSVRPIPHNVRKPTQGDVIGNLELVDQLGAGAHAWVWHARPTPEASQTLPRDLAVKIYRPDSGLDDPARRFDAEVEALRRVEHPNVVSYYRHDDYRELGVHWHFIAMEHLNGPTAERLLQQVHPVTQILAVFAQLADAVATLHARGVYHRDLKPENVLLVERDGRLCPTIVDFGVARLLDRPKLTAFNVLPGTEAYQKPVDSIPQSPEELAALDNYALGKMLAEAICVRPLHHDQLPEPFSHQIRREEWSLSMYRDVTGLLRLACAANRPVPASEIAKVLHHLAGSA